MSEKKSYKHVLLRIITVSLVAATIVMLVQLWFEAFGEVLLWKILGTLTLIIVVAGVLVAIASDIQEDQTHKKDNYLN